MGKKSLKRKTMLLKNKHSSKRRTIRKRRRTKTHTKMCLHCRCKLCKCSHMRRGKKTRKHKLKGGGNLNLSNLVPQDIRTAWSNIGYKFQNIGNEMAGISPPVSPMVTNQPNLEYNKMPIPLRTNISQSNALASATVNKMF